MFENFIKKISEEQSEKEITTLLLKDNNAKQQISELENKIKDGESKEELFNVLINNCKNEKLSNSIIRIINSNIKPYEEMSFFRDIDLNEFKKIIDYMIKNTLICSESKEVILKTLSIDNKNFTYALRLLSTVNDYVIIKRFVEERFKNALYDMFRFANEKSNYLWEVFNNNRQDLTNVSILNNISLCRKISDNFATLVKIFSEISDTEE